MLLTQDDVARLAALGFPEVYFVKGTRSGRQLKNRAGRCVFLKAGHCTVYDKRPEGCRLYPVVFEKDTDSAIIDAACPRRGDFHLTVRNQRQVRRLVRRLTASSPSAHTD